MINISDLYNNLLYEYLFSRINKKKSCIKYNNLLYKNLFSKISNQKSYIKKMNIFNFA